MNGLRRIPEGRLKGAMRKLEEVYASEELGSCPDGKSAEWVFSVADKASQIWEELLWRQEHRYRCATPGCPGLPYSPSGSQPHPCGTEVAA